MEFCGKLEIPWLGSKFRDLLKTTIASPHELVLLNDVGILQGIYLHAYRQCRSKTVSQQKHKQLTSWVASLQTLSSRSAELVISRDSPRVTTKSQTYHRQHTCHKIHTYLSLASTSPSPSLDNIRVMVIVWRLRGNIIRTALCWIV